MNGNRHLTKNFQANLLFSLKQAHKIKCFEVKKKHKTGENSVYVTAVISVSATSRIYVDLPLAVQGH